MTTYFYERVCGRVWACVLVCVQVCIFIFNAYSLNYKNVCKKLIISCFNTTSSEIKYF